MRHKIVLRTIALAALAFAVPAGADNGIETLLYSFGANSADGYYPLAGLVQGSDGDFYGTTYQGGVVSCSVGCGTVFKITSSGTLTSLLSFSGADGFWPYTALVQGSDGNFYGSASGTLFTMTPSGDLTALYTFSSGVNAVVSPLVQGTDGNFYGTTVSGGSGSCYLGCGTVFVMTPGGAVTTLYSFSGPDGASPGGGLVQGSDGNLYGTTGAGGAGSCNSGCGTVFKITPAGALTTLYSFSGTDGESPDGGLVEGSDGEFYGATGAGGASSSGTVFKITSGGTLTTLYSFSGANGEGPSGRLIQAKDGDFYGTTVQGGASGYGTVFRISSGGTFYTLYSFAGTPDGANPSGVIQGSDGNFYGTTGYGGSYHNLVNGGYGTVFRIAGAPPPSALTATGGKAQVTLNWTASSGASSEATSYNIYQGTTSGGESPTPVLTGVPNDSAVIANLRDGTTYYFEVAAVNANGTSALSNEASAEPLALPGPIVLLSAVPGNGQVVLHWSPSAGATDYTVFLGTAKGRERVVASGVTATNYVARNLTNGTAYYFGIDGVNSVGAGPKSKQVTATPN